MAILKPKSVTKTRTLSVRMPSLIVEEIEVLKALADERGLLFDVSEIVEKAVSSAIKTARAELEASPATGA